MKDTNKKVEEKVLKEVAIKTLRGEMAKMEQERRFQRTLHYIKSIFMVAIIFMAGWATVNVDPVMGLVFVGFGLLIKDI